MSPPWLVFEWLFVQGFARTGNGDNKFKLPGSLKAADALRDGVPLSAKRYLKTPTVFRFHGVYRQLARDPAVEEAGRLVETGMTLLTTWAHEQGLAGFCGTGGGPGKERREQLRGAVWDSLKVGASERSGGWAGWGFFRAHLSPHEVGPREAVVLRDALIAPGSGHRASVLRYLVSSAGRRAYENGWSERLCKKSVL